MNVFERIKDMWLSMIGDMSGRYHELRKKDMRGELNPLERNELETLRERLGARR